MFSYEQNLEITNTLFRKRVCFVRGKYLLLVHLRREHQHPMSSSFIARQYAG